MGLNRIVTLFHSKLNSSGEKRSASATNSGTSSRNGDSGSEHNEDFDSTMSLSSSSVESLGLPAPGSSSASVQMNFPFGSERDVNNNSNNNSSGNKSNCVGNLACPRFQSSSNETSAALRGIVGREFNESFPDVLLVLGTEGIKVPKRGSALSRRFSLKAKFSSDMDLYGNRSYATTASSSSEIEVMEEQKQSSCNGTGRPPVVKKSIWSSFRLPVRMMKGNEEICCK